MDTEQTQKIEKSLAALDKLRSQLCRALAEQPLTAKSLARTMEPYLPGLPQEELEQICRDLSNGIERGTVAFRSISPASADKAGTWISQQLHEMLEPLSDEVKRRYLLLFYQILSQEFDRKVGTREAVFLSNLSVQDLEREVNRLTESENARLAADTMDCLCDYMDTQEENTSPETSQYTDEENTWITSAALYIHAQSGEFNGLPAAYIGQQVGYFQGFLSKFKTVMLQKIIPAAMGLLAMAAAACLAYGLFQFLITCPELAPVVSYVTGMANWRTLQLLGVISIAEKIFNLGELVYDKTLQLTSRAFAERAAGALNDHYNGLTQRIEGLGVEPEVLPETAAELEPIPDGEWSDVPVIWQPSPEQKERRIEI